MLSTILVSIWAGLCGIDDKSIQMLRRPLLITPVIGMIMGDLPTSLLIGATLEVMWMGIGNVGAYTAPDIVSGAVIGTSLALASRGGVAMAVTLAVPTSLLSQQLLILVKTVNCGFNAWASRQAEQMDIKSLKYAYILTAGIHFLCRAVPAFIALQFGSGAIEKAVESLPEVVMDGLSVSGKIIPAVGIGVLMLMMVKDWKMFVFLMFGFVLTTYLGLAILPIALISLPFAVLYDMAISKGTADVMTVESDEDGGYDL
ncbi:MAG: PTS sugar transporter subunit IIC [Clostridium sp.]|nr:PTS sugar transporter subunit IIC [Clostridium sp.]